MRSWRRHNNASFSLCAWGNLESSAHSTPALWRTSCSCITAWYGNSTSSDRKALQRVVRTARHTVGGELPSAQDIYTRQCMRKARRIISDSSHPNHGLFSLLPSGRRLRSIRSCTSRLRDSFFPQSIRLLNTRHILICHTCEGDGLSRQRRSVHLHRFRLICEQYLREIGLLCT